MERGWRRRPRLFQQLIALTPLRSRRSAKFVTAIEWRPIRQRLRTALCSDGERGERRIEQTKGRCSPRDPGGSRWRTRRARSLVGSRRDVHQVSLDFVGEVERTVDRCETEQSPHRRKHRPRRRRPPSPSRISARVDQRRLLGRGPRAFADFLALCASTIASASRRSRSSSRSSSSTLGRYVTYFAANSCRCSCRIE